ncbi:MAG: response regulator, partial [Bacillota bacterium]|nr:response regulator [Bacillota bacterium]
MYKILIIEDDIKIRNELKRFLEKYSYEVEIYEDFSNFDAEKIGNDIHLILLDINLPQKDG